MLRFYEIAAITASLNHSEPEKYLNQWIKQKAQEGFSPNKENIMHGVRLLKVIRENKELPSDIVKNITHYSERAKTPDTDKTKKLLMDFYTSGAILTTPKKNPAYDPELFKTTNAEDMFLSSISNGYVDTVKLFIEAGIDVNLIHSKPLKLAISYALDHSLYSEAPEYWLNKKSLSLSHTPPECQMLKILLANGADPNAGDGEYLQKAIEKQNLPIAKILIDAGANITADSNIALRIAQNNNDYPMMKLLIENGADKNYLTTVNCSKLLMIHSTESTSDTPKVKFSPINKVLDSRKDLVAQIIKNLETNYTILPPAWDKDTMRPQNPVSNIYYKNGNRIRLMYAAAELGYRDPRWCTFEQIKSNNWYLKRGSHGVLCEKWIFEKEEAVLDNSGKPILDKDGKSIKKLVPLNKPKVNYFTLFNGEQISNIPELQLYPISHDDNIQIAESFIAASSCPIIEIPSEDAFYNPVQDKIVVPLRESFHYTEDFLRTAIHEMAHSTGHPSRLNRPIMNTFGSPEYALEELNAEIGCIFTLADAGIHFGENADITARHTNYIRSWISVLSDDPNYFFRACANAEKISSLLVNSYQKYVTLDHALINNKNYMVQLWHDFSQHNYQLTPELETHIKQLNRLSNNNHTLKELHQKWKLPKSSMHSKETELIDKIGLYLKNQEKQNLKLQVLAPDL